MRIQTKTRALLVSALAALLLAACSAKSTPVPASSTAAPSADQPAAQAPAAEEPTAAPEQPTAEAPTTAPAAASDSLAARLTSMKKADSFSVHVIKRITGDILDMPRSDGPVTTMDMEESFSGKNSRTVIHNHSAAADMPAEIETRTIDGKTYVKQVTDQQEQWIVLPSRKPQIDQPQNFTRKAIDGFIIHPEEAADYRKAGTESIDGMTCDIYLADATQEPDLRLEYSGEFDTIDKIEKRVLMCPDGQMHQFRMEIVGTSKNSPGTPASIVFETRMFAFGKSMTIETPKNVMEMPAP